MASTTSSPHDPTPGLATAEPEALLAVRRRGTFLLSSIVLACAGGFILALAGYAVVLVWLSLDAAGRLRAILGFTAPAAGTRDWLLIGVTAIVPAVGAALAAALWRAYRRAWRRRLQAVWGSLDVHRPHRRWHALSARASEADLRRRADYMTALLEAPGWAGRAGAVRAEAALGALAASAAARAEPRAPEATGGEAGEYERLAGAVLREVERDVMERAITVGLIVSVSQHRLVDLLTILVGTLEMQLHVLTRLGKQPSLAAWRLLLTRCGASLFVNTYLSRQDAVWVTLAIKKAAMGFQAAGDVAEEIAHSLDADDLDLDHGFFSGLLGAAEQAATFGLSVGAVGAHQLGRLVDAVGEELLQGVLAGGIMYYHGMALAADTLAADRMHRATPAMSRTLGQFARTAAVTAGSLLRSVVRQYRSVLRTRRRQAVAQVARGRGVTSLVRDLFRSSPPPDRPDTAVP